jgi:hypothetical protein
MWRLAMATSSMLLIAACTHHRALAQRDPAAAPTAQVATSADGAVNTDLLKQGYHTGTHNGELVYCRTGQVTGTRFRSQVCLTEVQILDEQQRAKDALNVPPQH